MKNQPQTPISNRGFDAQFLSMVPRHRPLVLNGVIASVDSLRIKFVYHKSSYDYEAKARYETIAELFNRLVSVQLWSLGLFDIDEGRECSFKIGNYMRTVTYKLSDGNSFAVLIGRYCTDASVKQLAPEIVMDFNPNKIPENAWLQVLRILAPMAVETSIQRFDLAIDIPLPRNQLQLIQRPGSGYQKFVSADGRAITEYTGERSHHAGIKLYDKGEEIGDDSLTCTRCEITIDPKKYKGINGLFPTITSTAPVQTDLALSSLPFEVQAVILHPDLYDLLKHNCSPNTWRKYRKMIEDYGQTTFALDDAMCKAIDGYVGQSLTYYRFGGFPE